MNRQQAELLERVRAFQFDAPGTTYPFAARLARENGWGDDYAARVIDEYRRFAYLAVAAGHPVSPPEAVDQAWHLHLIYTRSYWEEFCGKVLRTPLHHEPGRGGGAERAKFDDWYARTVDSYRRLFGADPPADVWPKPAPGEKAAPAGQAARVDLSRNWVVPKARLRTAVVAAMLALCLIALAAGCGRVGGDVGRPPAAAPSLNPLDLRGPQFLVFFGVASAVGFGCGWMIRSHARQSDTPAARPAKLDPFQIAYLNGGARHAVNAAVASLVGRGVVKANHADLTLRLRETSGLITHPLEKAVYEAVRVNGTLLTPIGDVRRWAAREVERIAAGLRQAGLIIADDEAAAAVRLSLLVALGVPAVGAVKVAVGISRGRPVEFLAAACFVTTAAALLLFRRRPHRTHAGDAALADLRARHDRLRSAKPRDMVGEALMLGVALYGFAVLSGTPLASLGRALQPSERDRSGGDSGSSGCSSTSCGSSCGTSGCGGGSSCGGGCGGCGGS